MMKRRYFAVIALVAAASSASLPAQEATQTPREQRQENRQDARQETRQERREQRREGDAQEQRRTQEQRQANRQERREDRAPRLQQRMNNRSQYYDDQTWSQLDPWITRNNVPPLERVARVAGAAVNATEKALNTASNAAEKIGTDENATFGYVNPNGPGKDGWFYDYYSYGPTQYSPPASGGAIYGSATRYYDLNNDGVYDSLNIFSDSDSNASYDVYDRYDFGTDAGEDKSTAGKRLTNFVQEALEDANQHTVSGKIFASKRAKVNGNEHLIVRLADAQVQDQTDKEARIVDLGPLTQWKDRSFKEGDTIAATGPIERIGEKRILIAQSARIGDGEEVRIDRGAPKIEGQVVDVTQTQVRGHEHTLAVVETEARRQLVDLGPSENLKVKIEPQTKIVVQGVPVRVRNHSVVQAEIIRVDGEEVRIDRWR